MGEILSRIDNPHLNYGLFLLQKLLTSYRKYLSNFYMPQPIYNQNLYNQNPLLTSELAYNIRTKEALQDNIIQKFNEDQAQHFHGIIIAVIQDLYSTYFSCKALVVPVKLFYTIAFTITSDFLAISSCTQHLQVLRPLFSLEVLLYTPGFTFYLTQMRILSIILARIRSLQNYYGRHH